MGTPKGSVPWNAGTSEQLKRERAKAEVLMNTRDLLGPNVAPAMRLETIEREQECLRVWSLDIDRYDAAAVPISATADAIVRIMRTLQPSAADIVAIAAAFFRSLEPCSHISSRRDAMACLVDIAGDHAGEAAADRKESELRSDERDPDEAYERRRDDARDFA